MAVDVVTEIMIIRPAGLVAAYAADPSNAPAWYQNITSITWETTPPLQPGSRIAFTARFLGRQLAYTYEITEFIPDQRLVMRTSQGPFPMETTYTWQAMDDQSTRMTLRNRGEPAGFPKLVAPLMATAMKRANRKDLRNLRVILETGLRVRPCHVTRPCCRSRAIADLSALRDHWWVESISPPRSQHRGFGVVLGGKRQPVTLRARC